MKMDTRRAKIVQQKFFALRSPWKDIILFILLVAFLTCMMTLSTARLGYKWQWKRVSRYLVFTKNGEIVAGSLIKGLLVTLRVCGVSLIFAFSVGLITALFRLSNSFVARFIARGYLEIVRNTPLLVQIYLIYFVLGPIFGFARFFSIVLALSLFEGAYASEVFRAGIVSIHKGQWQAAHSLGMSTLDTYRSVILPQAVQRILPPLTSQAISLVKDSALASIIAVSDLTMEAQMAISDSFLTFEIWFTVAAIYLVITVTLSTLVHFMEKQFKILT